MAYWLIYPILPSFCIFLFFNFLGSTCVFSADVSSTWLLLSSAAPNLLLSLPIEFLSLVIAFFS